MESVKNANVDFKLIDLIKCPYIKIYDYKIILATPATGILYITENSPNFISGHVRMRGKDGGRYPYNYLEMIDSIFGPVEQTIEVCSGSQQEDCHLYTVDINPEVKCSINRNGETLEDIPNNYFDRWRCDPPYSQKRAQGMYHTDLPITSMLLAAGARVCKVGALMFLLLGPQNYQLCPKGVKRIGLIFATIVPNNEIRALNIFYKYAD